MDRTDRMSEPGGEVAAVTATHTVVAKRWDGGWELHIAGVGVTQTERLADAEPTARDYAALALGVPPGSVKLAITAPELPRSWAALVPGMVVKYQSRLPRGPIGEPGDAFYSPGHPAGYMVFRVGYSGQNGSGWKAGGVGVVGEGYFITGQRRYVEAWFPDSFDGFEILDADQAAAYGL
ncbi:hypothetical protein [Actinomadura violacea]|uniref:Uncharacterized protein n=1 Tax=Actinomadura violacea TaxID=2819934 RepID=A0ABS3RYB3_9ACTN|nr:hypothetical protein [Actinomadura violacea]MBO2461730.1 hypothetical protein [Actinomadura violacea]